MVQLKVELYKENKVGSSIRYFISIATVLAYLQVILLLFDLKMSISEKLINSIWNFFCV